MWNKLYPAAKTLVEANKLHTMNKLSKPLVIVGPSGSGKSVLNNSFLEHFPDKVRFSVSCTTRPPRQGEIDGRDYNFKSKDMF